MSPVTKTTPVKVKAPAKRKPTRKRKPKVEPPFEGKFGLGLAASEVHLTDEERQLFMAKVLKHSRLLSLVRIELMKRSRVELAREFIGERGLIGRTSGGEVRHAPLTEPIIEDGGPLVLTSSMVTLPYMVPEEAISDSASDTDWRERALSGMSATLGHDLEDLALNGDERGSADRLLWANDGWLVQAVNKRKLTLRRRALKVSDVLRALGGIAPRYRDDEKLIVLLSTLTHKRLGGRSDLYGIEVVPSAFMPDGAVFVTHRDNLVAGFQRDIKLRKTTEGKTAIENDARYYAAHVRVDFVLQAGEASCVLRTVSVSQIVRAWAAARRQKLQVAWRKLRYPEIKRRLWNLQTFIAAAFGLLGGALFEAVHRHF